MRIGILGQPCIDEIVHEGQTVAHSTLGGVMYSFAAMERLVSEAGNPSDKFAALTWYANPDTLKLHSLFSKFTHMDRTAGLWPIDVQTNRVQLKYQKNGERLEHCPHILPALTTEQLTPDLLSSLDGLFINMISGFDVAIDTIELTLAQASKKPFIHLDIHALVLGELSKATPSDPNYGAGRQPHGVKEWRRWVAIADSIQLNELEVRWFADPEITKEPELIKYIQTARTPRPKYVIVTRAAKGATLFDFEKEIMLHAAAPPMKIVETTGSGDVFGSAFIFQLLGGNAAEDALREAVHWATWNAKLLNIESILTAPLIPN
jgi:hypothetical protein